MSARLKDIPELQRDGRNLNAVMSALHEVVQTYRGYRGDPLDRALTIRDLDETNRLLVLAGSQTTVGSGVAGPAGPAGPTGPAGTITPDPTAPPTATGLAVTAGLSYLYIGCDVPVYTQGHGHGLTVVYGAKWPTGAAAPTFSGAVELFSFTGNFSAYPTDTGTRWAIWIKWKSADGYLSAAPAGGTNGVVATTGKIVGADLNDLVITADKLSAGTYPNINLVPNGNAEDGLAAWTLAEGGANCTFSVDTTTKSGGTQSFKIAKVSSSDNGAYACRAFPVIPGETYAVRVRLKGDVASAFGVFVRLAELGVKPSTGYVGNGAAGTNLLSSAVDVGSNIGVTSGWTTFEATYTATAGVYWASVMIYNYITSTPMTVLNFDDVSVGRQITASFLAANSIAVGSLAVQNGAIVNAMLANATIDSAKIATLDAAKLTVGLGIVGGNLRSTVYTPGSAGWQVQPNGAVEFANATIRGQITGGAYTGYAWPAAGAGGGFYLGPSGLLLGSASDGKYFQVTASGDIYAPGFSIVGGAAFFGGSLAVGTAPAVSGTTMTGTGAVINANGTFALGKAAGNISYNGTTLTLNGQVVAAGNFQALAVATGDVASNAASNLTSVYTAGNVSITPVNTQVQVGAVGIAAALTTSDIVCSALGTVSISGAGGSGAGSVRIRMRVVDSLSSVSVDTVVFELSSPTSASVAGIYTVSVPPLVFQAGSLSARTIYCYVYYQLTGSFLGATVLFGGASLVVQERKK